MRKCHQDKLYFFNSQAHKRQVLYSEVRNADADIQRNHKERGENIAKPKLLMPEWKKEDYNATVYSFHCGVYGFMGSIPAIMDI